MIVNFRLVSSFKQMAKLSVFYWVAFSFSVVVFTIVAVLLSLANVSELHILGFSLAASSIFLVAIYYQHLWHKAHSKYKPEVKKGKISWSDLPFKLDRELLSSYFAYEGRSLLSRLWGYFALYAFLLIVYGGVFITLSLLFLVVKLLLAEEILNHQLLGQIIQYTEFALSLATMFAAIAHSLTTVSKLIKFDLAHIKSEQQQESLSAIEQRNRKDNK